MDAWTAKWCENRHNQIWHTTNTTITTTTTTSVQNQVKKKVNHRLASPTVETQIEKKALIYISVDFNSENAWTLNGCHRTRIVCLRFQCKIFKTKNANETPAHWLIRILPIVRLLLLLFSYFSSISCSFRRMYWPVKKFVSKEDVVYTADS